MFFDTDAVKMKQAAILFQIQSDAAALPLLIRAHPQDE
jgi:hypothetical protein